MEPVLHRDPHSNELRVQRHRVGSNKDQSQVARGRSSTAGHHDQLLGLAATDSGPVDDERTPVDVDVELAELANEKQKLISSLQGIEVRLHSMAGDQKRVIQGTSRFDRTYEWGMTLEEVIEKGPQRSYDQDNWDQFLVTRSESFDRIGSIDTRSGELNDVFSRRGGWPRFFIVTNPGGHIHSSTGCSTCYPTTDFGWLPELSGQSEAEAVDAHGGILCSVCFPSAPSEWTEGVSKKDAAEKEARAEAKRERDAAKLEKALMPDGQPLRLPQSSESLKTKRSAEMWLSDSYDDFYGRNNERHSEDREIVFAALEQKTGKSRDELMAETKKRVQAKRKRDGRG